jgi:hypothetical protein
MYIFGKKKSLSLIKKVLIKILTKYNQVRSCFEDYIVRNLMVQSKFNLDIQLRFMVFEVLNFIAYRMTSSILSFYACMYHSFPGLVHKQSPFLAGLYQ